MKIQNITNSLKTLNILLEKIPDLECIDDYFLADRKYKYLANNFQIITPQYGGLQLVFSYIDENDNRIYFKDLSKYREEIYIGTGAANSIRLTVEIKSIKERCINLQYPEVVINKAIEYIQQNQKQLPEIEQYLINKGYDCFVGYKMISINDFNQIKLSDLIKIKEYLKKDDVIIVREENGIMIE